MIIQHTLGRVDFVCGNESFLGIDGLIVHPFPHVRYKYQFCLIGGIYAPQFWTALNWFGNYLTLAETHYNQLELEGELKQVYVEYILGIAQDEIANQEPGKKQRRRCQVCFKYFDFDFNGIPHQRRILFCPLADDQQILKQYTAEQDEKIVSRNRNNYLKRKQQVENAIDDC